MIFANPVYNYIDFHCKVKFNNVGVEKYLLYYETYSLRKYLICMHYKDIGMQS